MGLFLLSWSRRVFEVEKVASKLSHREWGAEASLPLPTPCPLCLSSGILRASQYHIRISWVPSGACQLHSVGWGDGAA